MRRVATALAFTILSGPALAQGAADGCTKPGVSLAREATMMAAAHVAPGAEMSRDGGKAIDLPLKSSEAANLPVPPERPAKSDTFAGSVAFAPGAAGTYRVSTTEPAWIDVVQNGRYLEPLAVDGVAACANLTKSLKVALAAGAFVLQFSASARDSLVVTVAPAE